MRVVVGVIGALILALLIFHAGVVVGSRRDRFLFVRHGADRGFSFPFLLGGFALPYGGFIPNSHGAVGTITAVTLPTLSVETRGGTSETILVGTSTIIRNSGESTSLALSVGDQVVVLGEPDSQGRIDATLIRVLSTSAATSTTP